jgi:hypothetical protein
MSGSWRTCRRSCTNWACWSSRRRNRSRTSGNRRGWRSSRRPRRWTCSSGWRRNSRSRRFRFRRHSLRLLCFSRSFLRRQTEKMFPRQLSVRIIDRARVRLLFGNANFGQILDQDFRLDLEFPGELVYSDLIRICHQPLSSQFFVHLTSILYFSTFSSEPSVPSPPSTEWRGVSSPGNCRVSAPLGESSGSTSRTFVISEVSEVSLFSGESGN